MIITCNLYRSFNGFSTKYSVIIIIIIIIIISSSSSSSIITYVSIKQ